MNAQEAIAYIHSVSWKGSVPGLSRTRALLEKMGNPERKLQFIHIAGTNGKGSTAAMLASVLHAAGYRAGLFTSPYITRFEERMQVDGQEISPEELAEITAWIRPLAESCPEAPTEFELVTCVALEFFARRQCDIVVLEAGMGGALDSTNVIPCPACAVICNIGLDHTQFLGDTLEAIAETKAGIFKQGGTCVTYPASPSVEAVFAAAAQARQLDWHPVRFDSLCSIRHDLSGQRFDFGRHKNLQLPLLGQMQLHNAAVALTVLDCLQQKGWRKITEEAIHRGIAEVSWPGRFELLRRNPLFLVDGGHNPQCMQALVENLQRYLPGRQLVALTGVMADKDYTAMYDQIAPYCARFIAVTPDNPRAMTASDLAKVLARYGKPVETAESVEAGVQRAIDLAGPDGVCLAFGSLYMVGAIREAVKGMRVSKKCF